MISLGEKLSIYLQNAPLSQCPDVELIDSCGCVCSLNHLWFKDPLVYASVCVLPPQEVKFNLN